MGGVATKTGCEEGCNCSAIRLSERRVLSFPCFGFLAPRHGCSALLGHPQFPPVALQMLSHDLLQRRRRCWERKGVLASANRPAVPSAVVPWHV
jgi:hypothetical protein